MHAQAAKQRKPTDMLSVLRQGSDLIAPSGDLFPFWLVRGANQPVAAMADVQDGAAPPAAAAEPAVEAAPEVAEITYKIAELLKKPDDE